MYSTTVSVEATKTLTKYQLFVKEQQQRANENRNDDNTNDDPIESIIKGFARMKIS
uniref:Uncharacterized protein n=1 Tax=viral metagenome TaxID=1070528 RepID=A0A6C0LHE0_9ZZZZ